MKKKFYIQLSIVIIALFLQSAFVSAQYTFRTETPLFKQEVDNWCGAAAAQMILGQGGVNIPQNEVWAQIQQKNQDPAFPYGTEPDGLALSLTALGNGQWKVLAGDSGSQETVIQNLMKQMVRYNRPVALLVNYYNNPASHWVVWTGFTSDINPLEGNAALQQVVLNDPWPKTEGWPGTHGETWTISGAELRTNWLLQNPRGTTYVNQYVAVAPVLYANAHIDDTFIGEGYQYVEQYRPDLLSQEPNYQYADIISWQHWDSFNIYGMDVIIEDTLMTVNIETNYTPGIVPGTNSITTTYGDLFISNNGWAPDSEAWEYVFDVDTGNLYDIHDAQDQILLSNDVYGDPFGVDTYRHGQEVEIDSRGLTAIGSGSAQKSGDYYSLTFDISNLNLVAGMSLGFHWTMGCANDVIEGAVQAGVPEPSTVLLLGSGILGVLAVIRKKRQQ